MSVDQAFPVGYKQTEVGVIPEGWGNPCMREAAANVTNAIVGGPFGSDLVSADYETAGVPVIRGQNMSTPFVAGDFAFVSLKKASSLRANLARPGDIVFTQRGTLGQVALIPQGVHQYYLISQSQMKVSLDQSKHDPRYVRQYFASRKGQTQIALSAIQTGVPHTNLGILRSYRFPAPPRDEQRAIADALGDADTLLDALDRLIAKKRDLKQAAMQQLLTGRTRLPGFTGKWQTKTLQESSHSLDNVRVPLNDAQRSKMEGIHPYCGANGVLDHVNDFVIDDDIILMAEDGGYFDEYKSRPIAYRMVGKCWINNHAHVLKARAGFDQGFLFYSLVHKDVTDYLASGTRAKLNKSEMMKIPVLFAPTMEEQAAIATVLSDMDAGLTALKARRAKTRAIKQAMMQELLTGRTRLV